MIRLCQLLLLSFVLLHCHLPCDADHQKRQAHLLRRLGDGPLGRRPVLGRRLLLQDSWASAVASGETVLELQDYPFADLTLGGRRSSAIAQWYSIKVDGDEGGLPLLLLRDVDIESEPDAGEAFEFVMINAAPGTPGKRLAEQLDPLAFRAANQSGTRDAVSMIRRGHSTAHDRVITLWSMGGADRSRLYDGRRGLEQATEVAVDGAEGVLKEWAGSGAKVDLVIRPRAVLKAEKKPWQVRVYTLAMVVKQRGGSPMAPSEETAPAGDVGAAAPTGNTGSSSDSGGGLTAGAIVGIVLGSLAGLAAVAGGVYAFVVRDAGHLGFGGGKPSFTSASAMLGLHRTWDGLQGIAHVLRSRWNRRWRRHEDLPDPQANALQQALERAMEPKPPPALTMEDRLAAMREAREAREAREGGLSPSQHRLHHSNSSFTGSERQLDGQRLALPGSAAKAGDSFGGASSLHRSPSSSTGASEFERSLGAGQLATPGQGSEGGGLLGLESGRSLSLSKTSSRSSTTPTAVAGNPTQPLSTHSNPFFDPSPSKSPLDYDSDHGSGSDMDTISYLSDTDAEFDKVLDVDQERSSSAGLPPLEAKKKKFRPKKFVRKIFSKKQGGGPGEASL